MNRHHGFGGVHHPLLHLLVLVLIVGAVAVLAVFLMTRFRKGSSGAPPIAARPAGGSDPALEHARWRYASGDLPRDEYLQVVADLFALPQVPTPPDRAEPTPPTQSST